MVDPGAGRLPAQGTAESAKHIEEQSLSELKRSEDADTADDREEEDAQSAANADEVD
ncbi:MAG TPA: hypothetical protein VJ831_06865 [Jatrophihabitantaceae bacterium]|nr:hypothetical protein [Jatrophihabitantaceae bacterium]